MGTGAKVAGYARYSTQLQDTGVSIESQDREMRATCGFRGWTYLKTYADPAVSGATKIEDRPQLSALFEDAKSHTFDRVMAFDASRIARDQVIFWQVVAGLRELGIPFMTAIMPDIDSTMPEFEIVAGSLQGAASYERRLTSKKVKIGMAVLKDRGHHMGRPPAGLRIGPDGKLELDETGKRMRDILERFPDVKPSEVMAELSLRNYWQAKKLRDSVLRFTSRSES